MKVRVNNVRFSYVNVHQRRKQKGGAEGKYEITLILDEKENAADIAAVKAIQDSLKNDPKFGGKKPTKFALRRGDDTEARAEDPALGSGKYTIGARSNKKPQVFKHEEGLGLVPLDAESGLPYSGSYGHAFIDVYPYKSEENGVTTCGISSEILIVVYVKDGEPLTSDTPVKADDAFGDLVGGL